MIHRHTSAHKLVGNYLFPPPTAFSGDCQKSFWIKQQKVNDIPKRTEYHKLRISNSVIPEDLSIRYKPTVNCQQMSNSLEIIAKRALLRLLGTGSSSTKSLKSHDNWHDSFCNELSKDKHMNQMTSLALVHSPQACLHINSRLRVEAKCFLME